MALTNNERSDDSNMGRNGQAVHRRFAALTTAVRPGDVRGRLRAFAVETA
jgi:hypothetical protein